ncbi:MULTISPECIES: hypothetical protein [unclassified Pseudomonas]|uniref:hypothetical protein n=1 Tax=unclassified Pseudomonas TaxID=196821 RepID=UPI000D88FA06|nr:MULTISPECIES: hypothetical protein [unclassified Pseudomonas]PYG79823.1 hypothetical protein N428_02148 [Pseudomonas sp. RV120224-01c]PYG83673.1 hypothetical protein N436_02024 [Pseudomonas sp. RV120224-01b]
MVDKSDEIAELLEKLKKAGADVKTGSNAGPTVSKKFLDDLKGATTQDFDAWISWTKSF